MNSSDRGQVILFQTEDGQTRLEVQLQDETVWLTIDQMAELFQRHRTTILKHIKNVFEEGELDANVVCANFAHTTKLGQVPCLQQLQLLINGSWFLATHKCVYRKCDPLADLRDANGFCYGCKDTTFISFYKHFAYISHH